MAVTYDKISYPKIENGLKKVLDDEFQNVYISPRFKMVGNECIRIDLTSSSDIQKTMGFEEREYVLNVRYYFKADVSKPLINEAVKGKCDRLRKHILDNQTAESSTASWVNLIIDEINFNVQDEDNEEDASIYIVEYLITLTNYNQF